MFSEHQFANSSLVHFVRCEQTFKRTKLYFKPWLHGLTNARRTFATLPIIHSYAIRQTEVEYDACKCPQSRDLSNNTWPVYLQRFVFANFCIYFWLVFCYASVVFEHSMLVACCICQQFELCRICHLDAWLMWSERYERLIGRDSDTVCSRLGFTDTSVFYPNCFVSIKRCVEMTSTSPTNTDFINTSKQCEFFVTPET